MITPRRSPCSEEGTGTATPPRTPQLARGGPGSQSTWPRILGIISIILAVLGIFFWFGSSAWGILEQCGVIDMEYMEDLDIASPPTSLLVIGIGIASLVMSAWLLVGGIGLLRTRRWAPTTLKAWAVARIVVLVAWLWGMFLDWQELLEWERGRLDLHTPTEAAISDFQGIQLVGPMFLIVSGIGLLLWPLVLLVYLNLESTRREVEGWSPAQVPVDSGDQP